MTFSRRQQLSQFLLAGILGTVLPAAAQTPPLHISISPARITEGQSGTQTLHVPLFLSAASLTPVSVTWAANGGTAEAGTDFSPAGGTVTFAPGEVRQTIPLIIQGDTQDEYDETIQLLLSSPTGALLSNDSTQARIENDERLTVVSFPIDSALTEKNNPVSILPSVNIFNPQPGRTVGSGQADSGGTATPGTDYNSASEILTLDTTSKVLNFSVIDDTVTEPDEIFALKLSNPGPSVAIQPRNATQTIPPTPIPRAMAVDNDYLATSSPDGLRIFYRQGGQWLEDEFLPATGAGVYSVAVSGDLVAADFADSGVKILTRNPSGIWVEEALIPRGTSPADSRRVIALQDDTLVIGDPAASGQTAISGEVRVHGRHIGGPQGWGLATSLQPVSATPDFGSVVALYGNSIAVGAPGAFSVSLFDRNPQTGQITLVSEYIRILLNFGRNLVMNGKNLVMSAPGSLLTVRRSEAAPQTWETIRIQSLPQTQAVPQLYFQNSILWTYLQSTGLQSFVPGSPVLWTATGTLALPPTTLPANRRIAMSSQDLILTGSEADGSAPLPVYRDATSSGTIVDDDDLTITIADATLSGGYGALPVTLSKAMPISVTVQCLGVDGTASGGDDFTLPLTNLTIGGGTTAAYLGVGTTAPDAGEPVEQFKIKLQNPSMGTVGPDATVTIRPAYPTVGMTNFSYNFQEGNAGSTTATILVSLGGPAEEGASFDWETQNGSANAGTDFPAASGTVNLPVGATTASITVSFNGDTVSESDEYFLVRLTNYRRLSYSNNMSSTVNIANDDIGTLTPDSFTTPQNTPLSGVNVRSNDSGVDLIKIISFAQYGNLAATTPGAIVYTPSVNFVGTDTFTYSNQFQITGNSQVTTTATITVTDANVPPVLKPDNYNTREETLLDVTQDFGLMINDGLFNSSGAAFSQILDKQYFAVTNGTLTDTGGVSGTFKFMPAPNFSGVATFMYRVRDKDGWSLPALVRITVADDLPLEAPQRQQPFGSQIARSWIQGVNFPATGELDWKVNLKAGQTVSIRAGFTGPLGVLAIRDSAGVPLTGGISGFNSVEHVPIPADGNYLVAVGQRGAGSGGTFLFVVNGGAAPATSTAAAPYDLNAGQSPTSLRSAIAAVMPNAVAANHYSFNTTAGEKIRFYLHSSLAQSFTIQNPAGTVLASSTVSPHQITASSLEFTPTETGPHRVVVAGVRLAEYTLELIRSGRNLEYSTATLPLLETRGFGYLSGRGMVGSSSGGPVTTFAAFADYGNNSTGERDVAAMVKSWNPDFVAVGGDHNYASDYTIGSSTWKSNVGNYYGSFMLGRADNRYPEQTSTIQRFFPAPGNHDSGPDFNNGGELSGYFDYLYTNPGGVPRLPAGVHQPMLNYYKMQWGNTEFYFLDSDNASVNPGALNVQRQWLKDQLAASTAKWKFAVFHHPPYSSCSTHGSQAFMQWGKDFEGLTALFVGHDHTYERVDAGFGVTQFVVGLGGANPYQFNTFALPNTLARYNAKNGALRVVAAPDGVLFEFRAIGQTGGELIDSYQIGTVDAGVVASGADTWSLRVQPGQVFRVTTRTPPAPGILTNDLAPVLSVYDTAGNLIATDRNSAADGRNASVLCAVPAAPGAPPEGLLWTVKIANNSSGAGEYELEVTTPDTAAYNTWADLQISNPANPSDRETQADPDLDGVPNLLEYLLATDPTAPNADSPLTITAAAPPDVSQLLLRLPSTWTIPVTVQLQSSETLESGSWITEAVKNPNSPWTAPPGSIPRAAPGGGYTLPLPLPANTSHRFYRLRVGLN